MSKEQIDHPEHYGGKDNPYEAIKVIEAWDLGFCLGNVVKYIARAGKKGDRGADLKKALWYLKREVGEEAESPASELCTEIKIKLKEALQNDDLLEVWRVDGTFFVSKVSWIEGDMVMFEASNDFKRLERMIDISSVVFI